MYTIKIKRINKKQFLVKKTLYKKEHECFSYQFVKLIFQTQTFFFETYE